MNNTDEYVSVGDVCRGRLGMQCQYGSRYLDKRFEEHQYTFLGDGLRVLGNCNDYHSMRIHKDDVETFVERWEMLTELKASPKK